MGKKILQGLAIATVLLISAAAGVAQTWDPNKFLGVDALKRGDEGYVLTVLKDTQIEKLPIRILSVEKGFFPKGDLIWARGLGDEFQHMGTVAGMSGSPVFVNDKLIGALAYGASLAKDPIIGVTPIAQMLQILNRNLSTTVTKPSRRTSFNPFPSPKAWTSILENPHAQFDTVSQDAENDLFGALDDPHGTRNSLPAVTDSVIRHTPDLDYAYGTRLGRMAVPLAIPGMNPTVGRILEAAFSKYGILPVQGAGGGRAEGNPAVEPGSVLGIEFMRGDMSVFSYGTVTYRDGDRILAFGHPAMAEGDVHLPMSVGYVHYVLASVSRSFKVASAVKPVGTLVQDREPGIAGILQDDYPPFLPMTVRIKKPGDTEAREYHYDLLRHQELTGQLSLVAALSTMTTAEKDFGEFTVRTKARVEFEDADRFPAFEKENIASGRSTPGIAAAIAMFPVGTILNNWYEDIPIKRVTLDVGYEDARAQALIENIRINKSRVRPGDTVQVTVTYRPYLEDSIVKRYDLTVPPDAADGFALVFVGDANSYESWERSRARERYVATNAKQLLKLLARGKTADTLVVNLTSMNPGVAVEGMELPNLPLGMLSVMNAPLQGGESAMTRGSLITEKAFRTPYVISGGTLLSLAIDSDAP